LIPKRYPKKGCGNGCGSPTRKKAQIFSGKTNNGDDRKPDSGRQKNNGNEQRKNGDRQKNGSVPLLLPRWIHLLPPLPLLRHRPRPPRRLPRNQPPLPQNPLRLP
jgi:hypothetical protein